MAAASVEVDQSMASCGAPKRRGGVCELRAGFGTDHFGDGPCKYHGGQLPVVRRKIERERMLRDLPMLGGAIEVDPIQALLQAVYRAAGICAWLRLKVEDLPDATPGGDVAVYVRLEAEWLDRMAKWSKMALDAGVAERAIQIAERTGQRIAAALDEAVEPLDLDPVARAGLVERFVGRLQALEQASDDEGAA
jgi:hypothetical protein